MTELFLDTRYVSDIYLKQKLPNFIINYLLENLNKNPDFYKAMDNYLKNNYKISLKKSISICCKNFYCSKIGESKAIFKQDENNKYKNKKIIEIYSLINDGNLDVKGTDLFSKILRKINNNPKLFYHSYILSKGSKIWQ